MKTVTLEQAAAGYRVHPNGRVILPPPRTAEQAAGFCYSMGARDPSALRTMYAKQAAQTRAEVEKARAAVAAGRKYQGADAAAMVAHLEAAAALHDDYATRVPPILARMIEAASHE